MSGTLLAMFLFEKIKTWRMFTATDEQRGSLCFIKSNGQKIPGEKKQHFKQILTRLNEQKTN
jgi:hypothetical protein